MPHGAKHDGNARRGVFELGDGVLPSALAAATHDQQVTPPQREGHPPAAAFGAKEEGAWRADRDGRDGGARQTAGDVITVPGNAVFTAAVVAEA